MRGGDTTTKIPTSVVSTTTMTTTTRSSFLVASLIIFSSPCSPGNNVVVAAASFVVGGGTWHPSTVAPRRRGVTTRPRARRQEMANDDGENDNVDDHAVLDDERRNVLLGISRWWWCSSSSLAILGTPFPPAAMAASPSRVEADAEARIAKALPRRHHPPHDENISTTPLRGIHDPRLRDYRHPSLPDWKGTSLPGPLSLSQAHHRLLLTDNGTLPMAKYPDPILRIPSSPVPPSIFRHRSQWQRLHLLAMALRRTARLEGAVGLTAQQCGIDVRLIFLDQVDGPHGKFLVNPRIVRRSPESEMQAWTEECLVLPPGFRAALLRDAEIVVEYESLGRWDDDDEDVPGTTRRIALSGEWARCAQHEMDHDRGVLIVDHVPLEELRWRNWGDQSDVVTFLAEIENSDGLHDERMRRAYERYVAEPSSMLGSAGDGAVDSDSDSDSDDDDGSLNDSDSDSDSDSDGDSDGDSNNGKNSTINKRNSGNHTATPTTRKTNKPPFVSSANAMDDDDDEEAASAPTFRSHLPPAETTATSTTTTTTTSTTTSPSNDKCDDACLAERNETIRRRRAMMNQSRSNTHRGEVLELSRQRAGLYGTEFRGLSPKYCAGGSANGGGGVCP